MRLKSLFLLFGLILCMTFLVNCSRESSIKENVNLRNNHSVVFVYRAPFENPDAFADSIINLPNPDSVIVSDTITVTIGDTVYMMGFLRYNADKIYLYQWVLDSLVKDTTGKGKDKMKKALVTGRNATPQSWVYHKPGVYSPLFVAVDGNNATDTAGKDQFIRVINTPPYLGVPRDTLWTKAKSPVTFPILALDSFGVIKSFKVDLDAGGKRNPKDWKYEKIETSDSLLITIPYDSTLTDSLGNQKIYIIVTDDDNNTTKDSVYLHFNQLPTIKILGPDDQQRISDTVESFRLFYEGHDRDNEEQLRYYVRVAATPDNQEDDLNLSNVYDLVLKNSTSTSFAVIEDGENALKKLGYTGRYFSWDVWVTDGYDTVVAEKIKIGKKQRPRFFYLGPSKATCDFTGTATYEGLSSHRGIKITLVSTTDSSNIYTAETDAKGSFRVSELPAGTFKLTATDETGRGFVKVSTRTPNINAGDEKELPPILLKDPAPPSIYGVKGIQDTVFSRNFVISGKFSDFGSQVKTGIAVLDKDTCKSQSQVCSFTELSNHAWSVNVKSVADGNHTFRIAAIDSAGYRTDSVYTFAVIATKMVISVNGNSSAITSKDDTLTFAADIQQANPPVKKVYWKYKHRDSTKFVLVDSSSVSNGKASIKLAATKFKKPSIKYGDQYEMQAESDNGSGSNVVRFVFIDRGPMVILQAPPVDTIITPNDTVMIKASVLGNNIDGTNTYKALSWKCLEGKNASANCLSGENLQQKIVWTKPDTVRVILTVTNNDDETAADTLRIIVIADPPTITVDEDAGVITKKTKSSHTFDVSAKDRYGYVKELAWKCANDADYTTKTIVNTKDTTVSMTITGLPATEISNYRCVVRATDDDGQVGYDTLLFNIIKDVPVIRLNIHRKDVTIKDQEQLKYSVTNLLGGPYSVAAACGSNLNNVWTTGNQGSDRIAKIPEFAGNYYCVVRAEDSDDATLYSLDTVTYSVFLAPPTVVTSDSTYGTIKDTLVLYANAQDSAEAKLPGGIALYEWGCGPRTDTHILDNLMQNGGATYRAVLPATPYENYLCIVRVTDTDGLTAKDTVRITVDLAPPTVKVARDSGMIRNGFDIVLGATAYDKYEGERGYIVKREWSCGANSTAINTNWKTVSSYDTTWSAPAQTVNYFYCVARATDDDGNMATDTMVLKYSNVVPVITVESEQMYVAQGDVILLNASINNEWEGINWYSWQCFYSDTQQPVDSLRLLDYYQNGKRFYDYREHLSDEGRNVYCVVSAEEQLTRYVYRDTTNVFVLTQENRPVAKITAADTIYPWSGDEAQEGEALYYYTPEWGGTHSENGTLGDDNMHGFEWMFSNVGGGFYAGKTDGTLDTAITQFNDAIKRPVTEGEFTIGLVFWDSTMVGATEAFKNRHQADTLYRTVRVRRAWKNIASDTVVEKTSYRISPAITTLGTKLALTYLDKNGKIATKTYNGTAWGANISSANISIADPIAAMRMANNGSDLYLAVLTQTDNIYVYKSAGGTDAWTAVGSAITGAKTLSLSCRPSTGLPVVAYVKNDKPQFSYMKNSSWVRDSVSGYSAREVAATFTTVSNLFVVVFTDNSSKYNAYYSIYDPNMNFKKTGSINKEVANLTVATDGDVIYLGYMDRSMSVKGPRVRVGNVTMNGITLTGNEILKTNMYLSNIMIAAHGGKAYVIFDDELDFAFCHAFVYDGTGWKFYGENKLPYFEGPFYASNGYNLYGGAPEIAVASDGMVYVSMMARAGSPAAGVTPSQNNGPIVMKNVSKNWIITTKP